MRRRSVRALARLVPVALALTTVAGMPSRPLPAGAAAGAGAPPGTISTWAGGAGEGAGPNVSVRPEQLVSRGTTIYLADSQAHVVRALDTVSGQVRTVAGNGDVSPWASSSPRADGGPATADRLADIHGIAVDPAGRIFVDDYGDSRIRLVDTSGTISTYRTGAGFAGDELALDSVGNLYIVDTARVWRVTPTGAVTLIAGGPSCACPSVDEDVRATDAHFDGIHALAVDPTGHVYLGDIQKVVRIDDAGFLRRVAGGGISGAGVGDGGPATQATLGVVDGLAFDPAGNLYVADSLASRVRMVDTSGTISTAVGGGTPADGLGDGGPATSAALSHPQGVVVGGDGALYVSDTDHQRLRRVAGGVITTAAGNGDRRSGGDGGPATAAQFDGPAGIARDAAGTTYVADSDNNRVRKIDVRGTISTVAGTGARGYSGDGGPGSSAQLFGPNALATDAAGSLYISDRENGRIRKVDTHGVITTVAGGGTAELGDGGPATAALLVEPGALATDKAGNLYVGDVHNSRVRKVSPDGTISTVAGGGTGTVGDGDDGPATSARFDLHEGVALAVDALGQLYIGGYEQAIVRRVDLAGVITTAYRPADYPLDLVQTGNSAGISAMAFDVNGSLYFTIGGSVVVKLDLRGRAPRVAGTGNVYSALGDGGPAAAARVDLGPTSGIVFDPAGNLYAAGGGRIRRIEAVSMSSQVLATGWNGFGQLGDGTTTDHRTLSATVGLSDIRAVAAGYYHSLALRADGTVWAWGWNGLGQLGDGTTTDRKVPVQVPGLTAIVAVSAGGYHSVALRADGTVWTWGWNGVGQLGDGTTVDRHLPVQVPGLTGVRQISAGGYHNLVVTHQATVWAWGWNRFGQVGTGSPADVEPRPVPVPGLADVIDIAAGGAHSLAMQGGETASGTYSWGWNAFGQLGDGTLTDRRLPVRLGLYGPPVVAGGYHSVVGTYAWGYNGQGQTGTGSPAAVIPNPIPLNVSFLDTRVTAGLLGTAALKQDGTLYTWGWNPFGALGDGTGTDRGVPTAVPGTGGTGMAAMGALHTIVVR